MKTLPGSDKKTTLLANVVLYANVAIQIHYN